MASPPRHRTALAEHLVNDAGQVMVLLPPLPKTPHSWHAFGETVALTIAGEPPKFFALTPQAMSCALEHGWILVVEVSDKPERENWVELAR